MIIRKEQNNVPYAIQTINNSAVIVIDIHYKKKLGFEFKSTISDNIHLVIENATAVFNFSNLIFNMLKEIGNIKEIPIFYYDTNINKYEFGFVLFYH